MRYNNANFNIPEFEYFRNHAGIPEFTLSVKDWTNKTGAIDIKAKTGRYGGTYAPSEITMHQCEILPENKAAKRLIGKTKK